MDIAEINTTLILQRAEHLWWTKDDQVTFGKRKEGWVAFSVLDPIRKVFEEYGLTGTVDYEYTCFPSLKAARQAVRDVSLEAGLNIESGLTRQKYVAYKIGDLPFNIRREEGYWRAVALLSSTLPQSLKKYFNSRQEFQAAWESTDIALAQYPSRKAAHQAVLNWLAQAITEGK